MIERGIEGVEIAKAPGAIDAAKLGLRASFDVAIRPHVRPGGPYQSWPRFGKHTGP